MPNWRKVILSGSNAALNDLTVNNLTVGGTFTGTTGDSDGDWRDNGTYLSASKDVQITGSLSLLSGSLIVQGQHTPSGFSNEGIVFRYADLQNNSARIRLTTADNMQFNTPGSFQFNPGNALGILTGKPIQFNAEGNSYNGFKIFATTGSTDGAGRLDFEDKDGNQILTLSGSKVGIGTTAPQYKLDIISGSARIKGGFSQLRLIEESTGAHTEIGISNSDFFFKRGDNTHSFRFRKVNNTDVMTVDMANERVGIGIVNPREALTLDTGSKIHLTSDAGTTGSIIFLANDSDHVFSTFNDSAAGDPQQFVLKHNFGDTELINRRGDLILSASSGNNVGIQAHPATTGLTVAGNISASGNIILNGTADIKTTAGTDDIRIIPDNFLELGTSATDQIFIGRDDSWSGNIKLQSGDGVTMTVTGSKVGIGTTSPRETLEVAGNIRAVGNIIAEQYIVSSSVTHMTQSFSSGSTIFGDTIDDTHQFTGSLSLTGSLVADLSTDTTNERTPLVIDSSGNVTIANADFTTITATSVSGAIDAATGSFITSDQTSSFFDNLGNHTASLDLDLADFNIKNVTHITASGNISASGNITLADTVAFNTSTTSSSAGTLINPKIAVRPFIQQGAVNFAGEHVTTIGAKARASTSHSIEEGTIVVSGSLGNIGSAESFRTKIPIAKISMLGSSCEWDLQVEIHSTSSAFNPTKIIYPRVGIHLPNSLDATGYFGDTADGNKSFGPGVLQTATYSPSIANSTGGGEGADGSILNPSTGAEFIDMLGIGIHNLCLHHQGIGSMFPAIGNFEAAPVFMKGNSFKSWIKWWIPTSAHTNPNTDAGGEGDFVLGALSIDTGNFDLFESVKAHDSSKVIITMKYKYTN